MRIAGWQCKMLNCYDRRSAWRAAHGLPGIVSLRLRKPKLGDEPAVRRAVLTHPSHRSHRVDGLFLRDHRISDSPPAGCEGTGLSAGGDLRAAVGRAPRGF